jgi:hypothetical protein
MLSLPSPRRRGVLLFWHLSENGGFGKVLIPSTHELFFLHRELIISGEPIPGAAVTFTPIPALAGKVHPQATHCVIDNTQTVSRLKVTSGKAGA